MSEIDESFEDCQGEEDDFDDLFDCGCSLCHCFIKTNQGICADCRRGGHTGWLGSVKSVFTFMILTRDIGIVTVDVIRNDSDYLYRRH